MSFNDYFLMFTDEAAAKAALFNDDGSQKYDAAYDVIGVWSKIDNSNPDAPVVTPVDGYFVNVRSEAAIKWPKSVSQQKPATPWRVFA